MPADFAPDLNYGASGIGSFRFWCQKTLPLVYDDSLSYYELLCKLAKFMQDAVEDISTLDKAYLELQDYVNHYFDNLDVQEAIDAKLDEMAEDGTLGNLISQYITRNNDVVIITASYGDPSVVGYSNTILSKCKYRLEHNSGIKCYYGYRSSASFSGHFPLDEQYERITFIPAINMALTNIESEGGDPSTVGQVIIVGGGNDVWEVENRAKIANGMRAVTAKIKTEFPNAVIRFAWCSWRLSGLSSTYTRYNDTITLFKELCGKNGIGYCHNSEFIFHQYDPTWYKAGDSLHPSEIGADHYADGLIECILTGSCDVVREEIFINNPDDDSSPNPFMTRPASTQSEYHYPFQSLTDFTIRQVNENTYIIPGKSQYNPTCKLDSGFMGSFGKNPKAMSPFVFATLNSKLLHLVGDAEKYGGFPVNIFVVNEDNTICNTVNALGKYLGKWTPPEGSTEGYWTPSIWLNGVRDSTYYPCGVDGEARIYIPTVVLPTAYC